MKHPYSQVHAALSKILLLSACLLMLGTAFPAHAQSERIISGIITGENDSPLPGVNVIVKGTTLGTTSDIDGRYSLNVPATATTLLFSYVGYLTEEISIDGRSLINVYLLPDIENLMEIVVVGSRNQNRTILDSPVPIDIINISDLAATTGKVEINQMMQYAAPSFNATKQSGSDGADHIDPASLRGLGPDQTLVLINGKRRHQSSLVNVFGTRGRGNSGTDLNALPASAIKRIEVLRDGASAQYGSDAIAGVINIVLKDNTEGVTGGISYGAYSTAIGDGFEDQAGDVLYNINGKNRIDGEERSYDGNTMKIDLNYGMKLGDKGGFANMTTEYMNRERTLRPSWSWRKGYGTAAANSFNFMVNSAVPLNENMQVYFFSGRSFRDTDAYAFSRDSYADGDNRSVPSLYPNGFTPRITSNITDVSGSMGIRHTMANNWKVDFNNTYGKNLFHYYIKNSNNASMGNASPVDFDAGGHSLAMNTTGLDFSKYFDKVASGFNIAFGMEFRTENFEIFDGEVASYATYDVNGIPITDPFTQTVATNDNGDPLPGGSQGFPGYSPANTVDRNRTNIGMYTDAEINLSEALMVGAALRFEEYSDFGQTYNGKLASRYKVNEMLSFRGSVSTGFRAPSLAQIYYNLIFNNIVAGASQPTLLAANNSTVTKAFGIEPLKQETATNYSVGSTFKWKGLSASVDYYFIEVKDRIVLTDPFGSTPEDRAILDPLGVDKAQFFSNGVDTQTSGLDVVLSYEQELGAATVRGGVAANFNSLEITKIHNGSLNEFTFFGPFSQAYLQAAAPKHKINYNAGVSIAKFSAHVYVTQFSEVELQDFQWVDTPALTQADADALYPVATDVYEAAFTLDLNLSYKITKGINITVGANNLLNAYPTQQFDGWTDQGGFSDSVQMGADGRYIFGRIGFTL
ncbi:TonB-dependent receptor [Cytophagales bacterium LB-30]|uniref:TonB-dependent receptor n=1 Tax=Shiella aurantiaca TaxID=3058365 RepID=A0ABT8F5T1_9BACT|nr:TonB-dependent receptor [Shiella aurantiaca]MDN4165810.1 TonB-dependent receptor [Shiella aurantiaca]